MDIKKVLITDAVSDSMLDGLKGAGLTVDYSSDITPQKILSVIQNYDAILVRSRTQVTRQIIEAGKDLKLIARAGVGVDNVDIEAATERGVLVINAPNGNTVSACELTCAHILSISRNMFQAMRTLKDGVWNRKDFVGFEVAGKTLGIIGLGRIGREVGKRMIAFEMNVIGYDPVTPASAVEPLGIEFVSLDEIWKRSDYISVHVPLLPETKHLINRSTLAKCKQGVMVVNCARGGIVDEEALLEALVSKKVYAAALDVFEEEPPMNEELLRHTHVNPTPHLGASTHDGQRRVGEEIVDEIIKLTKGEKIPGAVNANRLIIPFLK
uniref:D-3-phosphoglycerate dehydrogenase n=1 Tax=Aceria tosichella TaxID=561515 RepID=A0A6G1SH91_9ACAR